MNGVGWTIGVLAATNLLALGGMAHARGWIPGLPDAFADRERALQARIEAAERADREKIMLLADEAAALGVAKRKLGDSTTRYDEQARTLADVQNQLAAQQKSLEVGTQALRKELLRFFPEEDETELPSIAAWISRSVGAVAAERDEAKRGLAAARESIRTLEERLAQQTDDHRRTEAGLEDALATLRTRQAKGADSLASLRAEADGLTAKVARMRKNTALSMKVTGAPVFMEWALVFYKDEDGNVRLRGMSFTEPGGYHLATGATHEFGKGVAVVVLLRPEEHSSVVTAKTFVQGVPEASGQFDLLQSW